MAPCLMRSWRLRATRHSPPITHTATNLHNTNCCAIVCVLRGSCWPCVVSHLDYILLLQPKRTTTLMVTPTVQGSIPFISVYFYNIKYVRRRRRRSCFLLKRKMKIERNFFFSKIVDADGSSRERGGAYASRLSVVFTQQKPIESPEWVFQWTCRLRSSSTLTFAFWVENGYGQGER